MKKIFATAMVVTTIAISCKKDDPAPAVVPTLTTTAVSNVSGSTATSGGTITSNGNATITASGICWSKTNNTPTISDDTTKGTTASGNFTALLKNLEPSATYYVRAYATNSAGTGYGNVLTFNTGNGGPQAKNIMIAGDAAVTNTIKVSYTYFDFENDPQATAGYQWYVGSDTSGGATGTAINGATDSTYTIAAGDQNKFLRVVITPKATTGTSPGVAANSWWTAPVGPEPTSVTFTYNGASVTYGIITSPTTGKKWLDRNIGATRAATAVDDYQAYGDLFQWGRPADGHQLITRTSSTTGSGTNGTTATIATTDAPGHNLFILSAVTPNDWRDNNNNNRWKVNPQGPCPVGWHVPTREEWVAEGLNTKDGPTMFTNLKIVYCGSRSFSSGNVLSVGSLGQYWASTAAALSSGFVYGAVFTTTNSFDESALNEARGRALRCIKD